MSRPARNLDAFGRRMADIQDRLSHAEPAPALKEQLLSRPTPRRGMPRAGLALGLAAALALALVVLRVGKRDDALTFVVGTDRDGHAGDWIAAPIDAPEPVRFSDGTLLLFTAGSGARVTATRAQGAEVILERGRVEANVVHREQTDWKLHAGPFTVKVTGTAFGLSWDPSAEQLDLRLTEGSVLVSGPGLTGGYAVSKGQSLRVAADPLRVELRDESVPPRVTTPEPAPSATPSAVPSAAPTVDAQSAPRKGTWRELAKKGSFKEALAEAEAEGFDHLCATSSAADLFSLADAARIAGAQARATQALLALRRRFAGDDNAAMAAFILGRMAFDQRGEYAEAARWFGSYLAERPGGSFAREAAGRQMEAFERAGDLAAANAAAARYLKLYPSGPHADKAGSLAPYD